MKENLTVFKNSKTGRIVLILSILVSGFWWLGNVTDVYRFAFVGAIVELLWLPMLGLLVILPIMSLIFLVKEKSNVLLYLFSILIVVATILFMVFSK